METTAPVACTLTSGDYEARKVWIQATAGAGSPRVRTGD
jgi:hypothetical protein